MISGYAGKMLNIDLSSKRIKKIKLNEEDLRKYIGGSGLGTKYLYENTNKKTNPLGENNIIIFMTGPLTGTKSFSSDRFSVITKSPLTNIYAESSCGGKWASMLKKSGFDGIIISGKSEHPIYIYVQNEKVELRDASALWGLDTYETQKKLKADSKTEGEVACIGPAGEKLVRYSCIVTGGKHARVAGRAGCGAVMGSKKLKAIVVNGDKSFKLHNEKDFKEFINKYAKKVAKSDVANAIRDHGTSCAVEELEELGDLPIKNWSGRRFKGAINITGQKMAKTILKKKYYCGSCVVGCGRTIEISKGKYKTDGLIGGPEYETIGMLGSNLLVDDLEAISKFNDLCNMFGLDTITTGSVIGMIMECYERGLLKKEDLDGIEPLWGDKNVIIKLIEKIATREGIGRLLGEGTLRIAKHIGSYAYEFAVQVKGLEAPAHDPRAKNSLALGYATSNRGACHLQSFSYDLENGLAMPDMGINETLNRFETKGKPEYVVNMQNLMCMLDSVVCCKFMTLCEFGYKPLTEALELITGFGINEREFLKIGERIFNLKRLYNIKCGISRKDDTLPPRYLSQKRGEGKFKDKLPPIGDMLDEYYKIRNWDEIGIPKKEKLQELELEDYC